MNVYDCANELAKAIRASHEYKIWKEAKAKIANDTKGKELVDKYLKLSREMQILELQKKTVPDAMKNQLMNLYQLLSLNRDAFEYLNTCGRFEAMMQDVSKTITDVIKEVADF